MVNEWKALSDDLLNVLILRSLIRIWDSSCSVYISCCELRYPHIVSDIFYWRLQVQVQLCTRQWRRDIIYCETYLTVTCVYAAADTRWSFRVDQSAVGMGRSTLLWWEETRPARCYRLLWGNLLNPPQVWRSSTSI